MRSSKTMRPPVTAAAMATGTRSWRVKNVLGPRPLSGRLKDRVGANAGSDCGGTKLLFCAVAARGRTRSRIADAIQGRLRVDMVVFVRFTSSGGGAVTTRPGGGRGRA